MDKDAVTWYPLYTQSNFRDCSNTTTYTFLYILVTHVLFSILSNKNRRDGVLDFPLTCKIDYFRESVFIFSFGLVGIHNNRLLLILGIVPDLMLFVQTRPISLQNITRT